MTNEEFNLLVKKHLGKEYYKSVLLYSNPHSNQFAIINKIMGAIAVVNVSNDNNNMFQVTSINGDLCGTHLFEGLANLTKELNELGR